MLNFTFKQMINCGMHIGHSIQNTLLLASWLLFKYRQNIWFINLQISLKMFKIAFKVLKFIVGVFGPIWFVSLDKAVERYISHTAKLCGEFFCSSWVNGMISNFRFIGGKFKKERENENILKRKNLMCKFWHLTRYSRPRLIFSFSAFKSAPAVSEALASGIPCIAVVDSNVKSQAVTLPIPGNDDSLDSIIFYNEIISNFILKCKFSFVLIWFSSVKKSFNFISFKDWLVNSRKKASFLINKNRDKINSVFSVNYGRLFSRCFISFFSQGYWLSENLNHFRYFYEKNRIILLDKINQKLYSRYSLNFKLARIFFVKALNVKKFFFRRRRKMFRKFSKRYVFCKLLMRFRSATYFIHGGFIRKYLTRRFKDNISSKKFFWNLCYLFYNNIRFSRLILHAPQFNQPFVDYSEWVNIKKGWSLSSEYNADILNEKNNKSTMSLLGKFKVKKKNNKFHRKLKRIFNRESSQEQVLDSFASLTNEQKFLNFSVYHKNLKKNLLNRLFLDLWIRVSLAQLGVLLNYRKKFGNSLKILKENFNKLKFWKKKVFQWKSKFLFNNNDSLKKKFRFNLGRFSFNEILPFFFLENNKNFLYSDRIHVSNFWYFWRFFCPTLMLKRLKINYMGPGFYLNYFNLFYHRKMPFIESLDYSILKSIKILKKFLWKKKKLNLGYFAKANLKMCNLAFMLTLDKRFDIVRRTRNKTLLGIENIRKRYNYVKNFKSNRKTYKLNRKPFHR